MQCIRAYMAQQPDELGLEKADVLLVHQQSSDGKLDHVSHKGSHLGFTCLRTQDFFKIFNKFQHKCLRVS